MEQGESSQSKGKENPLREFRILQIPSRYDTEKNKPGNMPEEEFKKGTIIWEGTSSDENTIPLSNISMPEMSPVFRDGISPHNICSYFLEEKKGGEWVRNKELPPNKYLDRGEPEDVYLRE